MIQTNHNETLCVKPVGLQDALEKAIKEIVTDGGGRNNGGGGGGGGRCFVRPSGTENVVRIYAEAPTSKQATLLAEEASKIVTKYCGNPITSRL